MFYHNRAVANANGKGVYQRSVNVDVLSYNSDGSMKVSAGRTGAPQIKNFNPYTTVQAETMAKQSGIDVENCSEGTLDVTFNNGGWVKIAKVDFGTGASSIELRVAATANTSLEIALDNSASTAIATVPVNSTGGLQTWATQKANVSGLTGCTMCICALKAALI